MHVPFHCYGLLLRMVLSVCACLFHNLVTLNSRFVSNNFGTWSYHSSLSNFTHISLHMLTVCLNTHACYVSLCILLLPILVLLNNVVGCLVVVSTQSA